MKDECPFCMLDEETAGRVILDDVVSFSLWDRSPVSKGHALVIPKRHILHPDHISPREWIWMRELIAKTRQEIDIKYHPAGYNEGFNVGMIAGQTIPHIHYHLIPRYACDVKDPRGGIRNVVPGQSLEQYQKPSE